MGGTTEAHALARAVADTETDAIYSYAGRVATLAKQPIPVRVGGFGGADGLATYLRDNRVSHVVDATHPFAAGMSWNAHEARTRERLPLIALTRAPWIAEPGDDWRVVADIKAAVAALDGPAQRVFLAIGRQNLPVFALQPQHHYLLRLVDPPVDPIPLPNHRVVVARGPLDFESERALMKTHAIDLVVSKNSGGDGARAKLEAARALGLPLIMIARPEMPKRRETHSVEDAMRWLHGTTDLGV